MNPAGGTATRLLLGDMNIERYRKRVTRTLDLVTTTLTVEEIRTWQGPGWRDKKETFHSAQCSWTVESVAGNPTGYTLRCTSSDTGRIRMLWNSVQNQVSDADLQVINSGLDDLCDGLMRIFPALAAKWKARLDAADW